MSFKLWSVTIAWLVVFGLFSAVGFGVVAAGAPLALLIGAALATPALVLRDSADARSRLHTKNPRSLASAA